MFSLHYATINSFLNRQGDVVLWWLVVHQGKNLSFSAGTFCSDVKRDQLSLMWEEWHSARSKINCAAPFFLSLFSGGIFALLTPIVRPFSELYGVFLLQATVKFLPSLLHTGQCTSYVEGPQCGYNDFWQGSICMAHFSTPRFPL